MIVAPSKAVNAGGVATSALEMAQNSERLVWTAEEVDKQLHQIMNTIYQMSVCLLYTSTVSRRRRRPWNGRYQRSCSWQLPGWQHSGPSS